jgi:hypothetical protein
MQLNVTIRAVNRVNVFASYLVRGVEEAVRRRRTTFIDVLPVCVINLGFFVDILDWGCDRLPGKLSFSSWLAIVM